ncbi:hypothetical protein J6590_010060 [Homalodisca vitripennis]|nr:hypothetical protein J6590_010060 [Homalodisca vitripennis]
MSRTSPAACHSSYPFVHECTVAVRIVGDKRCLGRSLEPATVHIPLFMSVRSQWGLTSPAACHSSYPFVHECTVAVRVVGDKRCVGRPLQPAKVHIPLLMSVRSQ